MHFRNVIGAYSALLSVVAAVPLAKRDIVWVTDVVEDVVTVPVTTTVWLRPGQLAPVATTSSTHFGHHHHQQTTANIAVPSQQATNLPPPAAAPPVPAASSPSPSFAFAPPAPSVSSAETSPVASSAAPAPTLVTSTPVAPAPTTPAIPVTPTTVAPTTTASPTTAAPAPVSSSPASGSGSGSTGSSGGSGLSSGPATAGKSYTGDLTWYQTGMGACGWTNTASEHIVAVSHVIFDAYSALDGGDPNKNPICGKYVTITGKDGSPYQAKVVDRCVGCAISDLDLSEDFFNTVTDNGNGRVSGMDWSFA